MTGAPKFLPARDFPRLSGASVRTVRRWIADYMALLVRASPKRTRGDQNGSEAGTTGLTLSKSKG
jgi:hypothetical protein